MPEEKTGLAFSGGGIRSAALSSGVLRRLLHRKVKIDYVSCVSGGNYTAAAYVDWKYRNNKEDDPKWHKNFFEHMRSRVGYICNWKNPLQGILESIILVFLLITVNLLIPCIIYSAGAVPSAYVIDYLLGTVMRKGFNCTDVPQISKGLNNSRKRCTQQFEIDEPEMRKPVYLFFFLFLAFFVSHVIKTIAPLRLRSISRYFKILSGSLLALTYIPWLMEQFTEVLPDWLYTLVIVLSIFFWLGFPPLRGKASLALVAYVYASVVRWRVYETSVIGIEYEEKLFYNLLLVSGFCLWLNPFVGMFSSTAIFTYYKWRLQRAFFTKKSVGLLGCNGISCRDFFPILSCYSPEEHDPAKEPLVMDDLKQVKPQYISNVAVDYWRKKPILKEPSYAIMALSPTENERIDHQPGEPSVEDKLYPKYVNQTDAMVTSAAVMALSPEQEEPFRDLQMLLGLTLRKGIRSNPNESFGCGGELASKILAVLIQSIAALPIILLAAIWHSPWDMKNAERAAIASFVVYFIIFFGIALLQTGRRTPCFLDNFARWCHVHLYHVRMLRELFQVNNVGPRPPALLSLSDGGRLEKFGLLPLLKKRLKRILIVDGSFIVNDEDYSKQILKSMDQARKVLNCEFVGFGGRDVKEEMRKTYVDVPRGRQPRYHRFKVQYYDKKPDESYEKVSEGDIMIIAPRYPKYGKPSLDLENNWDQYHQDTGERLDEKEWGKGPVLSEDEVDRLTFCCCECCHSNSKVLQWISKKLCLGFPSTSTVNQFFTSSLYTAYHREGYRACVESGAEEFLKECDATELADIV